MASECRALECVTALLKGREEEHSVPDCWFRQMRGITDSSAAFLFSVHLGFIPVWLSPFPPRPPLLPFHTFSSFSCYFNFVIFHLNSHHPLWVVHLLLLLSLCLVFLCVCVHALSRPTPILLTCHPETLQIIHAGPICTILLSQPQGGEWGRVLTNVHGKHS